MAFRREVARAGALPKFLPALPARGATHGEHDAVFRIKISTRAPREGSDGVDQSARTPSIISTRAPREGSDIRWQVSPAGLPDFYPRSPRGERLFEDHLIELIDVFLPALPARGATGVRGAWRA